ncbi:MAG: FG-GAP repeat domain-containing protein [Thiobacillaceae bacterium]
MVLEDVGGHGLPEVVTGDCDRATGIFSTRARTSACSWAQHVIDAQATGAAHDLRFADVDGDGVRELITNAIGADGTGLGLYKPSADPRRPWRKHAMVRGLWTEGLAAADVDGDGRIEIIAGPDCFRMPERGPLGGPVAAQHLCPQLS